MDQNNKRFSWSRFFFWLIILSMLGFLIWDICSEEKKEQKASNAMLQEALDSGPYYKVTEKAQVDKDFFVYFKAMIPELKGNHLNYEDVKESLFFVKTSDLHEYARLEKGSIYTKKDLPLAAVFNRIKRVPPPAEMTDKEE